MNYNRGLTCTSLFLLPPLAIGTDRLTANGFINAYLDDISHPTHYEDSIYILFKPHNLDVFNYFLTQEKSRITIIDDYDYEEYVVLVYKLPPEFIGDYQLFLEGKYSKFSEKLKNLFLKNSNKNDPSIQVRIITKDSGLKEYWEEQLNITLSGEDEMWQKPDLSKEVLDIEEVKEKAKKKINRK